MLSVPLRLRGPVTFIGYLLAAKLGLLLVIHAGSVSPIWPPTGIALAAVLLWGRGQVPWIFAAATLANFTNGLAHDHPWAEALGTGAWIGLGNALGPWCAALLLQCLRFNRDFVAVRDVWLLFAVAAVAGAVSAANGVVVLSVCIGLPTASLPTVFATWWIGDSLGYVGFAPALLIRPAEGITRRALVLPLAATLATCLLIGFDPFDFNYWAPIIYLTILPLVWLGVVGGPLAVAYGYVINAVVLVLATNSGHGQLVSGHYYSPLVALSIYLTSEALLAHLLGVWSTMWLRLVRSATAAAALDARFRVLVESTSDAYLLFGKGGVVDANPAALRMLDCPDKDTLLRHDSAAGPALRQSLNRVLAEVARVRQAGLERVTWTHVRPDGVELPVEMSLTTVRLGADEALLVIWHDHSARHQAEQRQELLSKVASQVPGMMFQFERTPDGQVRFPYASDGVLAMFGFTPEQLKATATPAITRIHPDDRRRVMASIADSAATLSEWNCEFRYRHPDGTTRWLHGRANPERRANEAVLWHGFTSIIDEQKEAEERLIQARIEAEQAVRAKADFLAIMSHELRTPLTGVIGMAQLIDQRALPPDEQEMVQVIDGCAQHLLNLINDILDFSRIDAGKIDLERMPSETRRLSADTMAMVRSNAEAKGLALALDCAADVPAWVRIDGTRTRQILANLLGNAVKFTETGSVTLQIAWESGILVWTIRDTGIGISSDAIPRLFTPFSQADASMNRRFGGTGLGLAISYRLAVLMGGSLTVVSTPGVGSTFTLRMPVELVAAPAQIG